MSDRFCLVLDHVDGRLERAWRGSGDGDWAPWEDAASGTEILSLVQDLAERDRTAWIGWRRVEARGDSKAGPVEPPGGPVPAHERLCVHAGLTAAQRSSVSHLGYIEQMEGLWSPNPGRRVDWLVSADAGWVHASALRGNGWWGEAPNFPVALIDFGRRASRNGMLCLVDDDLAAGRPEEALGGVGPVAGMVRRCHGLKWLVFWASCRSVHGPGRLSVWFDVARALVAGAGASPADEIFDRPPIRDAVPGTGGVSVVVPTLGRPDSVAALLRDLAAQTVPVREVVVVEQRAVDEERPNRPADPPYALHSIRVDWAGSCRARNLAMSKASGDWLLLLDDDVRCPPDFVEAILVEMLRWGLDAASARVVTPSGPVDEAEKFGESFPMSRLGGGSAPGPDWMWPGFAGGASMVRAEWARRVDGFDERLDLGYGEDFEFGLRLREAGARFLHLQRPFVVHYHEPMGGFRAATDQPWQQEEEPKPSPYILLSRSGLHPACRRGYAWTYLLGAMRSARWPWRLPGVLRRGRSARRWAARLAEGNRGGIETWRPAEAPQVKRGSSTPSSAGGTR